MKKKKKSLCPDSLRDELGADHLYGFRDEEGLCQRKGYQKSVSGKIKQ